MKYQQQFSEGSRGAGQECANGRAAECGASDANIRFSDLRSLLLRLGFTERVRSSHHIFTHTGVAEILILQPRNSPAKAYQVKQVRQVLVQYKLAEGAK